ncbi:recombinase family protein [Patescibacteria group bacterium]|nr:recombinase family protein [Patescibacteria group bacterium]MBP9709392.1 recombinase family protein [Patescibacteria group bacterium]
MKHFVIYARKSTESEDRQVLSIDSQIKELQAVAARLGYPEVQICKESMSAKAPGRPVFNRLLEQVEAGKIAGILCWKLDRLARNPVDGGRIIWCIKNNGLTIATPSQMYSSEEENTILMYVEFGMAQKYIDDLGKNVKRGNRVKLEMGWLPGSAPLGYLNKLDDHTVIPDPERFDLIRKMWDMALSGAYSIEQIRCKANDEWGFRTKKTKRQGGMPLSKSVMYKLFRSHFYYGVIVREVEGEPRRYTGAHKAMVSEQEFWKVQKLFGNPVPKPHRKDFPFTGLMRCGECGSAITAEEKIKPSGKTYAYYRCTKHRKEIHCGQKPLTAKELEAQFTPYLEAISIPKPFADWAVRWLRVLNQDETRDRTSAHLNLQKAYNDMQAKLDKLMDLRLTDLLTDDEYKRQKERLVEEQRGIKERLGDSDQRADNWRERVENVIDFAAHARGWFEDGDFQTKRSVVFALGSNFILKDGIVSIDMEKVWTAFSIAAPRIKSDLERLELDKNGSINEKTTAFVSVISSWQDGTVWNSPLWGV